MKARSPLAVALFVCISTWLTFGTALEARTDSGFGERRQPALRALAFTDREISAAIATLDRLLAAEKDRAKWGANANTVLWNFARHLQGGQLTTAQESQVL